MKYVLFKLIGNVFIYVVLSLKDNWFYKYNI